MNRKGCVLIRALVYVARDRSRQPVPLLSDKQTKTNDLSSTNSVQNRRVYKNSNCAPDAALKQSSGTTDNSESKSSELNAVRLCSGRLRGSGGGSGRGTTQAEQFISLRRKNNDGSERTPMKRPIQHSTRLLLRMRQR